MKLLCSYNPDVKKLGIEIYSKVNFVKNVELIAGPPKSGRIDVLVPRCLIGNGNDVLGTSIDQEGLSSIQIEWRG